MLTTFITTGQVSDFVSSESSIPLPGANESQERDKSVESDQTADAAGSTESPLTSASRALPACQIANTGYCACSGAD